MSHVNGERHPVGDAWGKPIPKGTVQPPRGGGKKSGGGLCLLIVLLAWVLGLAAAFATAKGWIA